YPHAKCGFPSARRPKAASHLRGGSGAGPAIRAGARPSHAGRESMGRISRRPLLLVLLLVPALALVVVLYLVLHGPPRQPPPTPGPEPPAEELSLARGHELYAAYCLACHGEKGEGDGPAARYVYPRPRNFGSGKFRIVTTDNGYPSDADLLRVITRGMPGSAMFPFAHLGEGDRLALVGEVRRLIRASVSERLRQTAAER